MRCIYTPFIIYILVALLHIEFTMSTMKVFKHVGLENLTELVQYNDLTGKFVAYRTFNKDTVLFNAQPVSEKGVNFHCNSFVSIKNEYIHALS